jgi:Zn-dependent protease with chaperone function
MHLIMLLTALAIAWLVRLQGINPNLSWINRWQRSLFCFLFSPLFLLSTAIAIICMGFRGEMLGMEASWLSYSVAVSFITSAGMLLIKHFYQGYICLLQLNNYTSQIVAETKARLLKLDLPYSAQIGFWDSQLVVSEGLLNTLNSEQLSAVIAHEQAHVYYRDTFWFFWLGWLRCLTFWLPHTESLWEELLLLREIRADRKAAETTDPLLLAESLVSVAQAPFKTVELVEATFSCTVPRDRIVERIESLLTDTNSIYSLNWWSWTWIILVLIPLLSIPLHY